MMNTNENLKELAKEVRKLYDEFASFQPEKKGSINYLKKCGEVYEVYKSTLQMEELADSSDEIFEELKSTKEWLIENLKKLKN